MRAVAAILCLLGPVQGAWSDDGFVARFDALLAERDDPSVSKQLEGLVSKSLAGTSDFQVLWRASFFKSWIADGTSDRRLKKVWGQEAWNLAERAIKVDPRAVEGHYYSALGIGVYSRGISIFTALRKGLAGRFGERVDEAIRLDPTFHRCVPLMLKGRSLYEMPWPRRDLKRSAALLTEALARCPENLRTRLYLAETQIKLGDHETARGLLESVLADDAAYDPPEGRRVKRLAETVLSRIAGDGDVARQVGAGR